MKYLAFDLETAKTDIPNGDDLMGHLPLGITCAATLTSDEDLQTWDGLSDKMTVQQCRQLVQYLWRMHFVLGYTIVGFNSASFDFRVLAEESRAYETCKALALDHIDFGLHFFHERGFMPGLNAIARGMGLPEKTGKGSNAPRLWAEGKREEVLAYVAKDVEVTLSVFEAIRKRGGEIRWISKSDKLCSWRPKSGRLLTVREAMKLPEPDVEWMSNYWGREKFTGWLTNSV